MPQGSGNMYIDYNDITPKSVVWANKSIYYDKPGMIFPETRSMFVITMINEDYFLGCPLTTNNTLRNRTVLKKDFYPIKKDSRISTTLYKINKDDILSNKKFELTDGTFEHFKRDLYQKIVLNHMESPKEYSDMFVSEYLKDHYPKVNDVVAYPTNDRVFKYYYVYDENDKNYIGLSLDKMAHNIYVPNTTNFTTISKDIRFYDYYDDSALTRDMVDNYLERKSKVLIKK